MRNKLTEGPLGFPLLDRQAFAVEAMLKELPREAAFAYRKTLLPKGPTEIGERSEVSWISAEEPDRAGDVVIARGMDDRQFQLNPIVTWNHDYRRPPVGRSLWRKVVQDGSRRGVKAKTHYPPRSPDWPAEQPWPPDEAFALIGADLLRGKSIGFLPTRVHVPDQQEKDQNGWTGDLVVIDRWVLLEYACVFLPCQQQAVLESVSKEFSFTALGEIERAFERLDVPRLVEERLNRLRGRVSG